MDATKIVTTLVFVSMAASTIGCRAKFTSKNRPGPSASAVTSGQPQAQSPAPVDPLVPPTPKTSTDVPVIDEPVLAPIPVVPTGGQPACPTVGDNSIDPSRVVQEKTIIFKRGRQMIWRKNCEGKVVSKTWENVPHKTSQIVWIKPQGYGPTMTVFNRSTCDMPNTPVESMILNGAPNQGEGFQIAVSTVPTNQALFVKPGKNFIDYEIPGVEKGTLILNVIIDNREGDCIVLNPRNCPPKYKPTLSDKLFGR